MGVGGCGDDGAPVAAVRVEAVGAPLSGVVGTPLVGAAVKVMDEQEQPVERVSVAWVAEDGTVTSRETRTDGEGVARVLWLLGPRAGEQRLTATVRGLEPATIVAAAQAGPPVRVVAAGPTSLAGRVRAPASPAPAVVVRDRYDNPVPGTTVVFRAVTGGGEVEGATAQTDAGGIATAGSWTLGPTSGEQRLTASVEGLAPVQFVAQAAADSPATAMVWAGDRQVATMGRPVALPPAVRVVDRYSNPVPGAIVDFRVTGGGGTITGSRQITDSRGVAAVGSWTLGPTPGPNTLEASAPPAPPVVFQATASTAPNLTIHGLHLTQAVQTYNGTVPLVAGRDALLRVFVTADRADPAGPDVRVTLFDGDVPVFTSVIAAGGRRVTTAPQEASLIGSWNIIVPGALVKPGLGVLAEVDPDDAFDEDNEEDNVYPASGTPLRADVRALPPFRVRFVPVHQVPSGATGNVHTGNIDSYLNDARALHPFAAIEADVRAPYSFLRNVSAGYDASWTTLLAELYALRIAEGSDRYYYGVVQPTYSFGGTGIGYIGAPAAVGVDWTGYRASTAAHEWGHNFNRLHAPCGGPANPDPRFPHPNARIGAYGYDPRSDRLLSPSGFADLMSYCSPEWVSDYTFRGVIDWVAATDAPATAFSATQPVPALLVWGWLRGDELVLQPAYHVVTRPSLPARPGSTTIEGVDALGITVFSLSFDPVPVADISTDERHFAFAVPLDATGAARLATIRLRAAGRQVQTRAAGAPPAGAPATPPTARRTGPSTIELRWDAAAAPGALVRDAATGQVLAFARGGVATIVTAAAMLDVVLSDGVRSSSVRVQVR